MRRANIVATATLGIVSFAVSIATVTAADQDANKSAHSTSNDTIRAAPWWQSPHRMLQTNLREIDATMDLDRYVRDVKEFGADVACADSRRGQAPSTAETA